VHSLVGFTDGSFLAQLGVPDMRVPIAHALAWPGRIQTTAAKLDLAAVGRLDFEAPDLARFPALGLARRALREGGTLPTILNAANEVAVEAFLHGRIGYLDIARVVAEVMDNMPPSMDLDLSLLADHDTVARRRADRVVEVSVARKSSAIGSLT
jgi:1-deoxy-D-xylulose-5-phosphate reductoisomerase